MGCNGIIKSHNCGCNDCDKSVCEVIDKLEMQKTVILPDSTMQTTTHTTIGELVNIGNSLESVIENGKVKVDASVTVPPVTVDLTQLIKTVEDGFSSMKQESDETQVTLVQIKQTQDLLLTATNTIDNIVNQINSKTITEQQLKAQLSTVESLLTAIKDKPTGGTGGTTIDYSQKLTDIINKLTAINTDTSKLPEVSTKLTTINTELTVFKTQVDADLNTLISQTDEIEPLLKNVNANLLSVIDNIHALYSSVAILGVEQEFHIKDENNITDFVIDTLKVKPTNVFTSMDIEVVGSNCVIKDLDTGAQRQLVVGTKLNSGNGFSVSKLSRITLTGSFKFTWEERATV